MFMVSMTEEREREGEGTRGGGSVFHLLGMCEVHTVLFSFVVGSVWYV